jgi:hypothetical protein
MDEATIQQIFRVYIHFLDFAPIAKTVPDSEEQIGPFNDPLHYVNQIFVKEIGDRSIANSEKLKPFTMGAETNLKSFFCATVSNFDQNMMINQIHK